MIVGPQLRKGLLRSDAMALSGIGQTVLQDGEQLFRLGGDDGGLGLQAEALDEVGQG